MALSDPVRVVAKLPTGEARQWTGETMQDYRDFATWAGWSAGNDMYPGELAIFWHPQLGANVQVRHNQWVVKPTGAQVAELPMPGEQYRNAWVALTLPL